MEKANEEMIQGYRDGFNPDTPEPSGNRSHSYRHGFKAGRNDISKEDERPFKGMSAQAINLLAAAAIEKDRYNVAS